MFTRINLNGNIRITEKGINTQNTHINEYTRRRKEDLTFHEYFHTQKNTEERIKTSGRWNIPHYTGMNAKPVLPPTKEYAQFVATVHKPWRTRPDFSVINWKWQHNRYIASTKCPVAAVMADEQAVEWFVNTSLNACPTCKEGDLNGNTDPEMQTFLDLIASKQRSALDDPCDFNFNYGKGYDWMSGNENRGNIGDGKEWLNKMIDAHREKEHRYLETPKWRNKKGEMCEYEIENLTEDQKDIMAFVIKNIKNWLEGDPAFTGVRMIINGKGGTGKTVLLKTITSVVRRIFQSKSSVVVSGPTGACSCHAGGKTDHSTFGLTSRNINQTDVSPALRKRLIPEFKDTVVCLFDERSMRESKVIGRMELTARQCAHGGNKTQTPWGGIPIVIQLGDDHQLPSYGKGVLFIPLPECRYIKPPAEHNKMIIRGNRVHLDFAETVMELPVIKRQKASETAMRDRLERARNDSLEKKDVMLFRKLHIDNPDINTGVLAEKKRKALYVFANCVPRDDHNLLCLQTVSEELNNPVAVLRAHYSGGPKQYGKPIKKHFLDTGDLTGNKMKTPDRAVVCVGCKVSICGRNFMPEWGLYNSAIGTVEEMHFSKIREEEDTYRQPNPSVGDLCDYVVVDFPGYTGPAWDPSHPTYVPVPVITERCNKGCCKKQFVPLELCFAVTIHKVEGLTIGPNTKNGEQNSAECMIVDIGSRAFETTCPGLFYTSYSRATTDGDGEAENSAIFFMRDNITEDRLIDTTITKTTKRKSIKAMRRTSWIQHLKKNTKKSGIKEEEKESLFRWASATQLNKTQIAKHIASTGYTSCVP